MKIYSATGRRKTAVAQVRMQYPFNGNIVINKLPITEYLPIEINRVDATGPLDVAKMDGKFDIRVTVNGGGKTGQTGAIRLGIARALVQFNEELKSQMRQSGFLTRDPRMVERKKYGQKKARKRFQFSKR